MTDTDFILSQLRLFADSLDFKPFPPEEIAREKLAILLRDHVVLVAEKEDVGPVGFIAGTLTRHWFNEDLMVLGELFWWVAPEHRGSRAGAQLLLEWNRMGDRVADRCTLALELNSTVHEATLHRLGYRLQERSFVRVTARAAAPESREVA